MTSKWVAYQDGQTLWADQLLTDRELVADEARRENLARGRHGMVRSSGEIGLNRVGSVRVLGSRVRRVRLQLTGIQGYTGAGWFLEVGDLEVEVELPRAAQTCPVYLVLDRDPSRAGAVVAGIVGDVSDDDAEPIVVDIPVAVTCADPEGRGLMIAELVATREGVKLRDDFLPPCLHVGGHEAVETRARLLVEMLDACHARLVKATLSAEPGAVPCDLAATQQAFDAPWLAARNLLRDDGIAPRAFCRILAGTIDEIGGRLAIVRRGRRPLPAAGGALPSSWRGGLNRAFDELAEAARGLVAACEEVLEDGARAAFTQVDVRLDRVQDWAVVECRWPVAVGVALAMEGRERLLLRVAAEALEPRPEGTVEFRVGTEPGAFPGSCARRAVVEAEDGVFCYAFEPEGAERDVSQFRIFVGGSQIRSAADVTLEAIR